MDSMTEMVLHEYAAVRDTAPLIHNITNYVAMNTTANALLAVGASPVMAHAEEEAAEMAAIAGALVVNIGTLSSPWIRAMNIAMATARKRGIPIVFDPVGAGATPFRTDTIRELLESTPPTIIRGNASEIGAVASSTVGTTKGVDSTVSTESVLPAAEALAKQYDAVVCVSGAVDAIVGEGRTVTVRNGHPMMPRVTALGCTATALCGAFAAVAGNPVDAVVAAMVITGVAGELAGTTAAGPGSFQTAFLDALYTLTGEEIQDRIRVTA